MARRIPSKPRYKIPYRGRSKIWFTKDSRLRRFFSIRGRQLIRRRRLFTRNVLVRNKIKWIIARRNIRPFIRPKAGRSRRVTYRDNFYAKQRFRAFFGKVEERTLRQYFKNNQISTIKINRSFFIILESRLDVRIYRIRLLPTIFACNQFIRTHGLQVGGVIAFEPDYSVPLNTIIAVSPKHWSILYEHLITRLFYRVYGKWILKKRQRRLFLKKFRWLARSLRRLRAPFYPRKRWAQLRRRFITLRNKRLQRLRRWRHILTYFYIVEPNKAFKFLNYLNLVEKSIKEINNTLEHQGRILYTLRRKFPLWRRKGFFYRNFFANTTLAFAYTYTINQRILALIRTISLAEQSFYEEILRNETFSTTAITPKVQAELQILLKDRRILLESRFAKDSARLKVQTSLFLRQRTPRKYNKKMKKYAAKPRQRIRRLGSAAYFILQQRRKRRRQRRLPRLKRVHWYIPSYIHRDIRTLQAVIIRTPKYTELYYPFQCSVAKILSFYKTRGY